MEIWTEIIKSVFSPHRLLVIQISYRYVYVIYIYNTIMKCNLASGLA